MWGANLTIRRSAIARVGPFDVALPAGGGDEEEWLRRLKDAGGRIRYVAAAGVDHRRVGRDARLRALARANYHRGRHARHWDAHKGTAPPIAGELRTLAGCVWHTARRRCGNGIVLAALTLGRLREALAPAPTTVSALEPDWASGDSGRLSRRTTAIGAVRDAAADAAALPARLRLARAARRATARRVLVVGVARPENAAHAARTARDAGALPPRGRGPVRAAGPGRGQVGEPQRRARGVADRSSRLAARDRRRRDAAVGLPGHVPPARRAARTGAGAARPRVPLPRRLGGDPAAAEGRRRGARASWRSAR